jgi:ankyrin repeat protein
MLKPKYLREFDRITNTPLRVAAQLDNVPIVRLLLEHGANVVQYDGHYPLCYSAIHADHSAEMVQLILDHRADPAQQKFSHYGFTPLHLYARQNNIGAMRAILRNGVDVDPIVSAWEIEPVRDSDLIEIPDRFECATMTTPTSHHKNTSRKSQS